MGNAKIDPKEYGLAVLMGSAVVIVTPIALGMLPDFELLTFEIIPNMINVGQTLVAGTVAFVADLGITKWLR